MLKSDGSIPRGGEKLGKPCCLPPVSPAGQQKQFTHGGRRVRRSICAPGTSLVLPMAAPLPWQQGCIFPCQPVFSHQHCDPDASYLRGEEVEMPSLKVMELDFGQVISQDVFPSCFLQCTDTKILPVFPK